MSKNRTYVGCHNTVTVHYRCRLDARKQSCQVRDEFATTVRAVRDSIPAGLRSQQEPRDATNPSPLHRLTSLLGAPMSGAMHPQENSNVFSWTRPQGREAQGPSRVNPTTQVVSGPELNHVRRPACPRCPPLLALHNEGVCEGGDLARPAVVDVCGQATCGQPPSPVIN